MTKYLTETLQYWQYKIVAGVIATVLTDSFGKLIFIFACLEVLDILTRWLAQSKACYRAIYPNMPATMTTYIGWLWQARKWRFIKSDGLRSGADKILTYLLLLLTAALADTAFQIGGVKIFTMTTIVVMFLATTEALSIIENISEITDYDVVKKIKDTINNSFKERTAKNHADR